ncbi:adenine deaminase [Dehalococcoides mccartyi]|jgi:adenine deaminase|uniref:Adenine deaminase n=1 Tax=Dehalococcoides mccartyi TaxID=61435 RepID=A0A142VA79_9CHLR|nr:adenine deaminase [Dehalococcoides mccartyi]AII60838.1 adenine deaminase [Dehalococcoides mccartyi CG5]AMU86511.1 adenine deaminase [Dehalococcoides mccartyi]AOV99336.1 adenine deaminase [Dehalococcoides mccartyi]AQX73171.1 adenine deaminase [Dehalococcoides mccartyi]MBA2085122.1 Adenine deaminase [Dehalococcoides mccartyi]
MQTNLSQLIKVARGETEADLVLLNARVINVFNAEIEQTNVAVFDGKIAGVGDYRHGKEVIDLKGAYLLPGLINGHTHVESSMLDIAQYARAVVSNGTLALITDLHEISNVCGKEGIDYVLDASADLPLSIFLQVPSCVPATHLETAGAEINSQDVADLLRLPNVTGLGEMMNFPGVLFGVPSVLDKIIAATGKVMDGHAPGLSGKDLNAYISAGIHSDHECIHLAEAKEKLARGMYIMIREGSSEKNLAELLPLVTDQTYKRCLFVVDDRSCADLKSDGDIDAVVRKAIRLGLDPVRAIQLASINTAEYFHLQGHGAIAPGYLANMIVCQNLEQLDIDMVFHKGKLVAEKGQALFKPQSRIPKSLLNSIHIRPFDTEDLILKTIQPQIPVIEVIPGQIVTRRLDLKIPAENGVIKANTELDLLKIVVMERHHQSGNMGHGLIRGFGLKKGAIASSVAHDSHNVVAVGTNDADLYTAIKELERINGGIALAVDGQVTASVSLPVAGLLSTKPLEEVVTELEEINNQVAKLGCKLSTPFATLSFMALPVIPELRLTDLGLVDVKTFKLIPQET